MRKDRAEIKTAKTDSTKLPPYFLRSSFYICSPVHPGFDKSNHVHFHMYVHRLNAPLPIDILINKFISCKRSSHISYN